MSSLVVRQAHKLKRRVLTALARPAGRVLCHCFGDAKYGARDRGRVCYELAQSLASQRRVSEAKIFAANGILAKPSDAALNRLNLSLTETDTAKSLSAAIIAEIQAFCCFVGYPRSGHSLIAALLDAHPQMLISHELHALQFLGSDLPRDALFRMIAENSRIFAFTGRGWSGYSYNVPGMWQGRYQNLKVIGDKKGSRTASLLLNDPKVLDHFSAQIDKPLRVIHIYRNPFDNIATISKRNRLSIEMAAEKFFAKAEAIRLFKASFSHGKVIDLAHESLIADAQQCLTDLCRFLDVSART